MTNNNELNRMKQLMNYGLNEGKKESYSGIEYQKVAADGKLYGIVREGTKYYIKVSSKKENPLTENFEYIGGFRNRKDNEYTSFASAQKNFDLKMMSLAEAYGKEGRIIVESWNPDKQEELTVEATDKMKREISRERQIMENAMKIFNRQPQSAIKPINETNECGSNPYCNPVKDKKFATPNSFKPGKVETEGNVEDANEHEKVNLKKTDIKDIKESSKQVLGWNRGNDDYMDKSHGTEIGDSMPFDGPEGRDIDDGDKNVTRSGEEKNGTIHEDASMIYSGDNQNTPKPGVGPIGDDDPFDAGEGRQIDEAIDDIDDDSELTDDVDTGLDDESMEGEDGFDEEPTLDGADDDLGADADLEGDDDLDLGGEDAVGGDLESRISAIEDKLDQILDAISDEEYEDDDLYDDDEEGDDEAEFDLEGDFDDAGEDVEMGDDGSDFEGGDEGFEDEDLGDDEDEVYESRAYRAMKLREAARRNRARRINEGGMTPFRDAGRVPAGNMNKLDDFGKHPAYQKVVMSLPPKDLQEFPDYYDMNDDSVRNDYPYGEKIGDGSPFNVDPDSIDNAIAESIKRVLKKNR